MTTETEAKEKAASLGAKEPHDRGVNWVWARGFPTVQAAEVFDNWCREGGIETRGVYHNNDGTASVRYRPDFSGFSGIHYNS